MFNHKRISFALFRVNKDNLYSEKLKTLLHILNHGYSRPHKVH